MDEQQVLLELYKISVASKDRFIERTFITNKFYLITSLIILVVTSVVLMQIKLLLLTVMLSGMGVLICALWWFNEDSYSYLLSIKYRNVLDVIEQKFPFAPGIEEFKAIQERRKKRGILKGIFIFQNSQKLLITVLMLVFFVFLLWSSFPLYESLVWRWM